MFVTHVTFRGRPYLLIPFGGQPWGTLTTEYRLRTGALGFAFLTPLGEVMRGNEVIGQREDVRFGLSAPWPVWKMPPCLN